MAESSESAPRFVAPRDLTDSELTHAFAACSSTDDIWLAVNQLLKEAIVEAMNEVSDSRNAASHGALAHAAGGLEYLGRFQEELHSRFAESHAASSLL